MKLFAVILMSILACATCELKHLNLRIHTVLKRESEWIEAKEDRVSILSEVNILQEITGDDWTVRYSTRVNREKTSPISVKLCDTAETTQDNTIIQLFLKTLGLEGQNCPIQPQTITNPEENFEADLEVEKDGPATDVDMRLMKGDELVVMVVLTTAHA